MSLLIAGVLSHAVELPALITRVRARDDDGIVVEVTAIAALITHAGLDGVLQHLSISYNQPRSFCLGMLEVAYLGMRNLLPHTNRLPVRAFAGLPRPGLPRLRDGETGIDPLAQVSGSGELDAVRNCVFVVDAADAAFAIIGRGELLVQVGLMRVAVADGFGAVEALGALVLGFAGD